MNSLPRLMVASLNGLLLAGCSSVISPNVSPPVSSNDVGAGVRQAPTARIARRNLYVVGGDVNTHTSFINVYAPGTTKVLRTITNGVTAPTAMVFDHLGNLYLANGETLHNNKWTHGNIVVYAPGSGSPFETISQDVTYPTAMAFSRSGNLDVIMSGAGKNPENIATYAPSNMRLVRRITAGLDVPAALAFDASDNLYVANVFGNSISVYAPGTKSVLRTIDVQMPYDLLFGRSGYLYVASEQPANGPGNIVVYAPGGSSPVRTIPTTDGYVPFALRWDDSRNLYAIEEKAADAHYGVIDGYAKGGSSLIRTIAQNGLIPVDERFDSFGNLYVADCITCNGGDGKDAVRVYAPGDRSPSQTIYVPGANLLAFGP